MFRFSKCNTVKIIIIFFLIVVAIFKMCLRGLDDAIRRLQGHRTLVQMELAFSPDINC